jgi:hypothetical protein
MIKGLNKNTGDDWVIERVTDESILIKNVDSGECYEGKVRFKYMSTQVIQNSRYSFTVLRESIKRLDNEDLIKKLVHIEKSSQSSCFTLYIQLQDNTVVRTMIKLS